MIKNSDSKKKYLILIVLLLAILLRAYNINSQSVWTDEAISVHTGLQSVKDIFWTLDPTPPLHNIILHFWIELFGMSAIAIRSLSVILSVASVYMIYLVGNLINKKIGIYAALLLAISPISILYAQEARAYTLLFLTSLLSMYFYIKYLKNDSKINTIGYIISSALMMYSYVFGICIILAQNIYCLFHKMNWKWIITQVTILLLYLPWLLIIPRIITNNYSSGVLAWTQPVLVTLLEAFGQFSIGIVSPMFGILLMVIFLILIVVFLLSKEKKSLLLLWFTLPIIIPLLITILLLPIYSTRHTSFAVIPFILIIALGLNTLPKKIKSITLIIIVILTLSCVIIQQNTHTKDDWKKITQYIGEKNVSQIAIMSWYEAMPLSYYYNPHCILTEKNEDAVYACLKPLGVIAIQDSNDVNSINATKVLLVTSRLANTPKSEEYIKTLKEHYYFEENVTFYAYDKTFFTNQFFNTIDPKYGAFNRVVVYTLVKK